MVACSFETSVAVAAPGGKANANSVPRPGMSPESGCNSMWPWAFGQILPERVGRFDVTGARHPRYFVEAHDNSWGRHEGWPASGRNALRGGYFPGKEEEQPRITPITRIKKDLIVRGERMAAA